MAQGEVERRRGLLGGVEGEEDAGAEDRINEARGVACEQPAGAVHAGVAVAVVADGVHFGDALRSGHARAHDGRGGEGLIKRGLGRDFRRAEVGDVHHHADARAPFVERDEPEPVVLSAHEAGERGVASLVALHAFVVREDAELLQVIVAALEIELRADDGIPPGAVEHVGRADFSAAGRERRARLVECDAADCTGLADFGTGRGCVIEEHLVEPRALDLVRAAVAELHGALEIKALRAASARGGDFAAGLRKGMVLELIADAEPVEERERMREQRLADLETREGFLFAEHDAPACPREEDRRGGSGGAAPDDCDVCM